ncbi:hypothetical protein [Microbacterium sp. USHLN272]|uniref:hypothetical protein n=1 Tax=Microbacterium sp. USHLN272 TaxID=3081287 RepID=UPI0030184AAF
MDQSQVFTGVVLPGLAVVISTVIAVWIAASERRAAKRDRAAARTEALIERAVAALSGLMSERFGTTAWDRQLRALVGVANSLETVDDPRSRWLGKWLRAETYGVANALIKRALSILRFVPGWRVLRLERRLPQILEVTRWAQLTLWVVIEWSHRHIDDSLLASRTRSIEAGKVDQDDELRWHQEVLRSPLILRRPLPDATAEHRRSA